MKRKLLVLIATSLLLVGCNTNKSNSPISSENSSSETSSSSSSSSEDPGVVLVSEIKLSKKNIHLNPGKSTALVATVLPENATHKEIKWVIGNSDLISYENGKVVAGSSTGNTTIYALPASEEDQAPNFKHDTCEVVIDNEVPATYDYDGYYEGLTWTDSEDLIDKLHTIISTGYTSLKYDGNWATNQGADQALDDFEMVDIVYSNDNILKSKTYNGSSGWQREHAFAASLMTGYGTGEATSSGKGRATDFHNLFASSNTGNGSRNNKNFGIADPNSEKYQETDAYKFDAKNFEPSIYDRGRLSRALFYMAVMYNQPEAARVPIKLNYNAADAETAGQASETVTMDTTYKPLQIVEDYVPYDKYTYTQWHYNESRSDLPKDWPDEKVQALRDAVAEYGTGREGYVKYSEANCQYAIGNLSTLLTWGSESVDYLEMQHNNYVHKTSGQGNRNPFVDYPELVSYCFGALKDEAGSLADLTASYTELEMDKDEIRHYAIETAEREYYEGAVFDKDCYVIKAVKNDLSVVAASYQDQTESYTFTHDDVVAEHKDLLIKTPINDITLNVKVNAGAIDSCSYIGEFASKVKADFTNGKSVTVDTISWDLSWTNTNATPVKADALGFQFGTAAASVGTMTLETSSSYLIDKIYYKGSCASQKTINVKIYVGEDLVVSEDITRPKNYNDPFIIGDQFSSKTGKIKVVITATNSAVYLHTLAFNVVS